MIDSDWDVMLKGLRAGEESAYVEFWKQFGAMLEAVANKHLSSRLQRRIGPDDLVQSVCRTFFRRVTDGQFQFDDSDSLWRLLCTITVNKARRVARNQNRQKRSLNNERELEAGDNKADANMLSPSDQAELADQVLAMLSSVSEQECQILDLKLQRFTNDEIAEQVGCSERSVRRILKNMQVRWIELEDA